MNGVNMECRHHTAEVAEVLKLVKYLYEDLKESCGGLLHIVLDDGNLDDDDIQWCLKYCDKDQNKERDDKSVCIEIARKMLNMNKYERRLVYYGDMKCQCGECCDECVIENEDEF